jgi:hypothetical protein
LVVESVDAPESPDFVASYVDRTAYSEVFDDEVDFFIPFEELLPDAVPAGVDGRAQTGPVPPAAIEQAEQRLGIELPAAYVYFVNHHAAVSPSFEQWMRDTTTSFERSLSGADVPGPYAAASEDLFGAVT